MQHAVELFIANEASDEPLRRELCLRLGPLVEGGLLREAALSPPEGPQGQGVQSADIVVLLLSAEALAEGSAVRAAMTAALARESARQAVVVPIRAGVCAIEEAALQNRLVYPRDGRALTDREHEASVFREALWGVLTGIALCHVTVGDFLLEREREVLAAGAFRRALAIADRLTSEDPEDHDHLVLLALVRDRLADALLAAGDGPMALTWFQQAKEVRERLVRIEPGHHDKRRALARCHESIGEVLRALGEKPDALAAYRQCLSLREQIAAEVPHEVHTRELSTTFGRIGHMLRAMGDSEGALHSFRTGLGLVEALATDHDEAATHRAEHALFCFRAATVLGEGGKADREEARLLLQKALVLYRDLEERGLLTRAQAIWPPAVEALLDTIDTSQG